MRTVIRDTFIVWFLATFIGLIVSIAISKGKPEWADVMYVIGICNLFLGIAGFTLVGALAKSSRFKHLFKVTVALQIIALTNLLGSQTLTQWLWGFPILCILMVIGGAISYLFVPNKTVIMQPNPSIKRDA